MEHRQITYGERSYNFDPDCNCDGCRALKRYPEPTECSWCHQVHCGDSNHCLTEKHGTGDGVRGADQADNGGFENDRELEILCDDVRGRIKAITNFVKENYGMKPAIDNTPATQGQRAAFESGGKSTKKRDGFPFLKKENLSTTQKRFKVLDVREQEDVFSKTDPKEELVMAKIALEGKTFLWPLRYNNPNLKTLQDAWGLDEKFWMSQEGALFTSVESFDGTSQIRVEPDAAEEKPRSRKK